MFFMLSLTQSMDEQLGAGKAMFSLNVAAALAGDHEDKDKHAAKDKADRDEHEAKDEDGEHERRGDHDHNDDASVETDHSAGDTSCVCPPGVRSCVCADGTAGSANGTGGLLSVPSSLRSIHGGS